MRRLHMRARNAYLDWRGNERAHSVRQRAARVCLPTAPSMPMKTPEQRAMYMQHCARALLVRRRTPAISVLRVHVGELGIVRGPTVLCSPQEIPLGYSCAGRQRWWRSQWLTTAHNAWAVLTQKRYTVHVQ